MSSCSMNQSVVLCCFLTSIHISQEAGQVVWYSYLLKNFPQFIVIHTVTQSCPTLGAPQTVVYQTPLYMEFSRQEYWSGLPCPPSGDLPKPEVEPRSLALQTDSLPSETPPVNQSVQWLIHFRFFTTPWTSAHQTSLFITGKDWRQDEKGTTEVEPQGKPIIQPACTW